MIIPLRKVLTDPDTNAASVDHGNHEAMHHDPVASKMGMWLFLFTEVILFGTMFIAFAVYLSLYTKDFMAGSAMLDVPIGAVNTVILLTSSLTMALSIWALQKAKKTLCLGLLGATVLFAAAFLVIKGFEWSAKFHHHIYPNSPLMELWPRGKVTFYGLYFAMTGLHALHVLAGALVILIAVVMVQKGKIHDGRIAFLENTGLYWHLVDVIWIYLFPLFYLIG
jgi:cytochrome c oxidase subunit 3